MKTFEIAKLKEPCQQGWSAA